MRDFFSSLFKGINFGTLRKVWTKFTGIQKIIALGSVVVLIVIIVAISMFSSASNKYYVFTNPITDVNLLNRIANKLDIENIEYIIGADNKIQVMSKSSAQYARTLLVQEDLIPGDTDPWELFDTTRWTQTDFERNINLQRSITKQLELHLKSLDDVDSAKVTLVLPADKLFAADRNPVTASVILTIKPGSNFRESRKKLEGVEKLILFAVEGLTVENLTVSDSDGARLNDFENYADFDSLNQTQREIDIRTKYEKEYTEGILKSLNDIYSEDRVRIVNINLEIDWSKKTEEVTENFPIVVTQDNPNTPYDETEVVLAIPRSQENIVEKYSGTGFNPEGPPGVEGQTPPSYKDLDGIVGSWDHNTSKVNNEINQRKTTQENRPTVKRVTASVAIDGMWERIYTDKGRLSFLPNGSVERKYIPLDRIELTKAQELVESAVGYSQIRGDNVSVRNIAFDRTVQFELEDGIYRRRQYWRTALFYGSIVMFVGILLLFLIRFVAQQVEINKVKREEQLAEQYRKLRQEQMRIDGDEDALTEETELDKLTQMVKDTISGNTEQVSILIKNWMEV